MMPRPFQCGAAGGGAAADRSQFGGDFALRLDRRRDAGAGSVARELPLSMYGCAWPSAPCRPARSRAYRRRIAFIIGLRLRHAYQACSALSHVARLIRAVLRRDLLDSLYKHDGPMLRSPQPTAPASRSVPQQCLVIPQRRVSRRAALAAGPVDHGSVAALLSSPWLPDAAMVALVTMSSTWRGGCRNPAPRGTLRRPGRCSGSRRSRRFISRCALQHRLGSR